MNHFLCQNCGAIVERCMIEDCLPEKHYMHLDTTAAIACRNTSAGIVYLVEVDVNPRFEEDLPLQDLDHE